MSWMAADEVSGSLEITPPHITQKIIDVDTLTKSVLPTGRIKVEKGIILQEAEVIVHKSSAGRPVGLYVDWIPMANIDVEELRIALAGG
jgi:hypothetical protein